MSGGEQDREAVCCRNVAKEGRAKGAAAAGTILTGCGRISTEEKPGTEFRSSFSILSRSSPSMLSSSMSCCDRSGEDPKVGEVAESTDEEEEERLFVAEGEAEECECDEWEWVFRCCFMLSDLAKDRWQPG